MSQAGEPSPQWSVGIGVMGQGEEGADGQRVMCLTPALACPLWSVTRGQNPANLLPTGRYWWPGWEGEGLVLPVGFLAPECHPSVSPPHPDTVSSSGSSCIPLAFLALAKPDALCPGRRPSFSTGSSAAQGPLNAGQTRVVGNLPPQRCQHPQHLLLCLLGASNLPPCSPVLDGGGVVS